MGCVGLDIVNSGFNADNLKTEPGFKLLWIPRHSEYLSIHSSFLERGFYKLVPFLWIAKWQLATGWAPGNLVIQKVAWMESSVFEGYSSMNSAWLTPIGSFLSKNSETHWWDSRLLRNLKRPREAGVHLAAAEMAFFAYLLLGVFLQKLTSVRVNLPYLCSLSSWRAWLIKSQGNPMRLMHVWVWKITILALNLYVSQRRLYQPGDTSTRVRPPSSSYLFWSLK